MRTAFCACCIFLATLGCASQPPAASRTQQAATAILTRSDPADGASVAAPVNALQLIFARPVRLIEVTLEGPDGLSPMMITAPAETPEYSVPLPALSAGAYRVSWRAIASGQSYNGALAFTVRD